MAGYQAERAQQEPESTKEPRADDLDKHAPTWLSKAELEKQGGQQPEYSRSPAVTPSVSASPSGSPVQPPLDSGDESPQRSGSCPPGEQHQEEGTGAASGDEKQGGLRGGSRLQLVQPSTEQTSQGSAKGHGDDSPEGRSKLLLSPSEIHTR